MLNIEKKTVIITGGTRGIGRAIVELFLSLGANVIATGTTEKNKPKGYDVSGYQYRKLDLLKDDSVESFIDFINNKRVDILINNAGINRIDYVNNINRCDWDDILKVNLTGCMSLIKAVSSNMIRYNISGKILNISSIFGAISKEKRAAYSASKFGLRGLTCAAALDLADKNILVNALAPGFTDTELTRRVLTDKGMMELSQKIPMKRLGTTEEMARWALFLCSDGNTYITGQTFFVDGGFIIQ